MVFDAIGAARSKGTDLVLVDTAGRLQTKHNLMEELEKIRRVVDRLAPEAHVESLLVLDASQGQNGLKQAMAKAGKRLGLDAKLVPISDPVAAIDVDKLSDHVLAENIMMERAARQ